MSGKCHIFPGILAFSPLSHLDHWNKKWNAKLLKTAQTCSNFHFTQLCWTTCMVNWQFGYSWLAQGTLSVTELPPSTPKAMLNPVGAFTSSSPRFLRHRLTFVMLWLRHKRHTGWTWGWLAASQGQVAGHTHDTTQEMENKHTRLLKLEKLEGSATRRPGNGTGQIIKIPFRLGIWCRISDTHCDTFLFHRNFIHWRYLTILTLKFLKTVLRLFTAYEVKND